MELNKRVDKLLETVRPMADRHRKVNRTSRLKGASMRTILDALKSAVAPEDQSILDDIGEQMEEYEAQPPRVIRAYGKEYEQPYIHGFIEWLCLLQDGVASLPDRFPRKVLLAWRDRYVSKWGFDGKPWCPMPFWRCEDCKMVLPHGEGGWGGPCPVCGGSRIWCADLSKRLGANWKDPHAAYRGSAAE